MFGVQEHRQGNHIEQLLDALNKRGLEFRQDSPLCTAYLFKGVGRAEEVADAMLEVHWLKQNTPYFKQMRKRNIKPFPEGSEPEDQERREALKIEMVQDYIERTNLKHHVPPTLLKKYEAKL